MSMCFMHPHKHELLFVLHDFKHIYFKILGNKKISTLVCFKILLNPILGNIRLSFIISTCNVTNTRMSFTLINYDLVPNIFKCTFNK